MSVSSQQYLRKRKYKRRKIKFALYGGGFFLCIFGLFYFIFLGPYFHIKHIAISGQNIVSLNAIQQITQRSTQEKFAFFFSGNNIFIFSDNKVKNIIQNMSPNIKSVEVKKDFLHKKVIVTISERQAHGVLCRGEQYNNCFYFDSNGMVFMQTPFVQGASVLLIKEDDTKNIVLPFLKYTPETINFLTTLKKDIFETSNIVLGSFFLRQYGDVEAHSSDGVIIFFTQKQSSQKQVEVLKNIIEKEVGEDILSLDYIDLRIENRVYFKLKEQNN